MSVIRDVVEVIKDISEYNELEILKNKPKGSLTRMTKDAVLQFPVIASNSLDIQLIGLVNKALERNFASLLKIAFSLNSITDERDLTDYIRQFHQNTGLSDREFTSNLIVDRLVNECKIEYKFGETSLTESDKALIVQKLTEDNHRLLREYLSELNLDKLNDKMLYIAEAKTIYSNHRIIGNNGGNGNSNNVNDSGNGNKENTNNHSKRQPTATRNDIDKLKQRVEAAKTRAEKTNDLVANYMKDQRIRDLEAKNQAIKDRSITKANQDKLIAAIDKLKSQDTPKPKKQTYTMGGKSGAVFTPADVVKANEIMPLPLELKVYIEDNAGNVIERDFMIGVKAVIHPVSSEYMIDSMMDGYRRGKFFFNFIKATTGEIKFFKDFVFMIDNIKTDAMKNASGTNNKWFSFLKRRALLAKFKNTLRMKHQLLPNTSIVLSGEEADILKQQGVDILDPKVARDLISHYFLLSVVIIDPALEIVHIIYDGEEQYSSMSVMALNREAKEDSNSKQILSLLKSRPQF